MSDAAGQRPHDLAPILGAWLAEIAAFADRAESLAIGLFGVDGQPRYLNAGMRRLLAGCPDDAMAAAFAAPTFAALRERESTNGPIHEGWLTLGSDQLVYRSIRAAVYRREDRLLVIGETDVEELERVNHELMAVNREITNLQRELARRQAELVRLNEQKNEFLGIAAHDLRSPLTVVQGFASLLLNRPEIPAEERNELLTMIMDSVKEMLAMLNNLLSVSAIESGKLRLQPQALDLAEFLERVVRLNRPLAEQKRIALRLELPPALPRVHADPERIQQVMSNLLSNAFKFSRSDTTVTVSAAPIRPDAVEIAVTDQGQGIRADELNRVFMPFQRTSTRATAGEHSTGLGLAICKRIVELSGGQIGVESELGKGSRFYFTLSAVSGAAPDS